jgi:PBSX family phage portal protein
MTDNLPAAEAAPAPGMEAFTFGDPTPVLDGREVFDYLECWWNGRWYEPPLSLDGLSRSIGASVYLQSGLTFKRNMLSRTFMPHRLLSRQAFEQFALDWLWCGNGYLERRRNQLGQTLSLQPALAKYMRRGRETDQFYQVTGWQQEHEFEAGTICHLREADIHQEIYGMPEWMAALQSALLNESATLFRRRYYLNGSHAGFILYVSDAVQDQKDVDAMREALKKSKGPGNFRNLFLYSPNGKKDGIQVIPVSEVAAKDDFFNIKNVSRDDVLAAHRIPPQLMGIVPSNTGGFGAVLPAAQVFARNELLPLQQRLQTLNDWLGEKVVRFDPYVIASTDPAADDNPKI